MVVVVADVFVSKVRPVGSSLGIIIPKQVVENENLEAGKEVRVSIIRPDFKKIERLIGTVVEKEPFKRDRQDRV